MKKSLQTTVNKSFDGRLKEYSKLSKAIVLKPIKNPKSLLPLGAAFLAGVPSGEAAIIYSGVQNVSCNLPSNTNRCYVNLDLAGGNDFEIHRNVFAGDPFIQADEVPGGGFSLNGFLGTQQGNYAYPYANAAGVTIGPAGPWAFGAGQGNTLSEGNNAYPNDKWTPLPAGTTRFLGIRGVVGGNTVYGWMRLTKNGLGNFTIVDWAYENTPNTPIIAGTTVNVSLINFDGRLEGEMTKLDWKTASEVNNAGFDIERSEDGKNYKSIGWVDGKGNTPNPNSYNFDDKSIRTGKTYYYRLRQVDFSGQFEYSPLVTITVFGDGPVVSEFYPNPSGNGSVKIDFAAQLDGKWNVVAYDVAGKELRREQVQMVEGINHLSFDFSDLGSGLFFIKMDSGNEKIYRKLTID